MANVSPFTPAVAESADRVTVHAIAPQRVVRGPGALQAALPRLQALTSRPVLLGRSPAMAPPRQALARQLHLPDTRQLLLHHDCCDRDLLRLETTIRHLQADGVIALGGGKVLDAGKLLAHRCGLPCVAIPGSAATCAGWTALANVYSEAGAFIYDVDLARCPELLIFDHQLVATAPARTMASGIADAMAKWYEASLSSGHSQDALVRQAVEQARLLRDQLLLECEDALAHPGGAAWRRVVENCGLTAGLIGGLGGVRCRTAAAHAVHNGLTQLAPCRHWLHGEKVAVGILVQLRLEEVVGGQPLAVVARDQLLHVYGKLGLPTSLADLGIGELDAARLDVVCRFTCREGSDLHHLPFAVTPTQLEEALRFCAQPQPIPAQVPQPVQPRR
ncbi:MAG: oxidoreductase [Candidatus Synechococcus spongiarum SP3]|uniref:Oxidoreductase n=1 Tax=Candidatus Synechococcus spongiarum SP3 TaxID=1604020 RepID=A0A0G2HMD7_9SYNE|nr:MAG: oxidoreductase [Candidatus Synechococcus spongiarum SP3]